MIGESNVIIDSLGNEIVIPIGSTQYSVDHIVIVKPSVFGMVHLTNVTTREVTIIIGEYTNTLRTMSSLPPNVNREVMSILGRQKIVATPHLAIMGGTYLVDSQLAIDLDNYNYYCESGTWGTTPRLCFVERVFDKVNDRRFQYWVINFFIHMCVWLIIAIVIVILIAEKRGVLL